ncbi:hypothetical protein HQQ80_11635 [Microbacteriaceae bacterium VKM Ac-2855]|nr:hypothetical protein [Microbacteriaceae bacterium VKM Ac-2855]
MINFNRTIVTGMVCITLAVGAGTPAAADPVGESTIDVLQDVTDQAASPSETVLDDVANVHTDEVGVSSIDATVAGIDVDVPTDPSRPITLDSERVDPIAISLPFASQADDSIALADGVVSFDNGNSSTTVAVVKDDGSVQMATILADESAPTHYRYVLDVPEGGALVPTDDGGVMVVDREGAFVAGVAPAWAQDATGVAVPTHYEVDGVDLVQVVDHSATSISYPVTADPWLGINLFDRMSTTTDQGQPRYMLYRSAWGAANSASPGTSQSIFLNAGWAEASSRWPALRSKESLHQQYDCHAIYALLKPGESWNLEKFRSNNSGWGASATSHWCNW